MASDLLLGFILGVALVGIGLPMKGVLFTILEQKKQIQFLRDGGSERGSQYHDPEIREKALDDSYPNRKENT